MTEAKIASFIISWRHYKPVLIAVYVFVRNIVILKLGSQLLSVPTGFSFFRFILCLRLINVWMLQTFTEYR
jgi:hypothetical protein